MHSKLLSRLGSITAIGAVLAATALLSSGSAFAQDAKTTTWRVQSHWPTASSSYDDSLVRIKNIIEERTEGRLKLKLYPAGALFKAQQTFNAVKRGTIEMGTISPAYAQNQMSLAGIASGLPFAFRNVWEVAYFHKNLGFEDMLREEAAEHGVYYSTDKVYPTEMVVNKPINSYADFKGLKIRSSGALETFLTKAGASASYIPGGELYTALSSGVVDGAHWGAAQGAASMSLYEVAKYHVKPALNIAGTDAFIINQEALDALSEADAKIVRDALDEQFWYRTNEYLYLERLALSKAMANDGVKITTLPPEVQKKLTAVARESWDEMGKRSDKAGEALDKLENMLQQLGYIEAS
ncbi:TRAP transporter substrate-binding protein DctP [Salinisphaera aquimarina]|uniref:TRAP transporter substrate-binding protein DctP n=1 Tax=Salinisphaera aquimarina TaxID=2094031 RepID=A0ABV7EW99_9GAMM